MNAKEAAKNHLFAPVGARIKTVALEKISRAAEQQVRAGYNSSVLEFARSVYNLTGLFWIISLWRLPLEEIDQAIRTGTNRAREKHGQK